MLTDRRYVLYLLAVLVNIAVYIQYVSTLPLAMADAGAATIWYSSAIALNGLMVICCELLLTKVTQRLPLALVVTVGFTLLGVGQLVYALPWGVWVFIAGTLIWTIAEITAGPTMASYPGRMAARAAAWPLHRLDADHVQPGRRDRPGARRGDLPGRRQRGVGWCAVGCAVGLALALAGMHARHRPLRRGGVACMTNRGHLNAEALTEAYLEGFAASGLAPSKILEAVLPCTVDTTYFGRSLSRPVFLSYQQISSWETIWSGCMRR